MLRKIALPLMALPVLAAGVITFHPGVSLAQSGQAGAAAPLPTQGDFTIDPAHTSVGFDIGHLGLSRVQGRFTKLTGTLHADAKDLSRSSVNVVIDASSVDTAVPPRDADLRSANFFDVARYPDLTFASTAIRKSGSGYVATGNLTLKGVTKPVTINFKSFGPIKDPWGNTRFGIVADPLVIHRSDFGMTFDLPMVSDDVTIRLSMEATLKK